MGPPPHPLLTLPPGPGPSPPQVLGILEAVWRRGDSNLEKALYGHASSVLNRWARPGAGMGQGLGWIWQEGPKTG